MEVIDDDTPLPPYSFTATSNSTNENTTLRFRALGSDLLPNRIYNITIEAENRAGGTNSTGVIQLSEFL